MIHEGRKEKEWTLRANENFMQHDISHEDNLREIYHMQRKLPTMRQRRGKVFYIAEEKIFGVRTHGAAKLFSVIHRRDENLMRHDKLVKKKRKNVSLATGKKIFHGAAW
jgi:hypothetical protein